MATSSSPPSSRTNAATASRWAAEGVDVEVIADEGLTPIYGSAGPRAWVVRPDGHLASSLPLTNAAKEAQLVRLAEMVGSAAGRGRGPAPG